MISVNTIRVDRAQPLPPAGDSLSVLTWNLGYAGLGAESDFIADGGTHYFPPSAKIVRKNVDGVVGALKTIDADVYVFPEAAKPSPVNYWNDLLGALTKALPQTQHLFSADLLTRYLPWPLRFEHGLALFSRKQIGAVPMPRGTQGLTASPDGKRIIAMDLARPELAVIDTATDTVLERIALSGTTDPAYKAYYSPDGKWLLTMAGSSINIFDAANLRGAQRSLTAGASPMGIAFSADGKTALVANHGDGTVSVVDLATAKVTKTFKAGMGIETLTYY